MRPAASLLQLALCLSTAAPLVSAWPGWLSNPDALFVRDDNSDSSGTPTPTATETPTASSSDNSQASNNSNTVNRNTAKPPPTGSQSVTQTGTQTGSQTGTATGSKSGNKQPTQTQFPPDSPAGSVIMQTPATTAAIGTPLYIIGDYVTWGWNYTNLLGTPTAIDVIVSCPTASQTWTLTSNMTFQTAASYVWNTKDQADSVNSPLLTAMYNLIIKDTDATISEAAQPGYLGTFSGLQFGLYTLLPYEAYPDWTCTGCNAASPSIQHHAVGFAVTMSVITVLSFTWFVSGLGLH